MRPRLPVLCRHSPAMQVKLMPIDILLTLPDKIGVYVFALSGGIAAVRKDMDIFGIIVLSFFPAIGGGTLRDIILDVPVFWLTDNVYLLLAASGGLTAFFFTRFIEEFKPLRWADALGTALFAVTGTAKALELGNSMAVALIMGVMTATAGGVIRDVVANRDNFLMSEEIYASAALFGAVVFATLTYFGIEGWIATSAGISAGFGLRGLAIVFNLTLPKPKI